MTAFQTVKQSVRGDGLSLLLDTRLFFFLYLAFTLARVESPLEKGRRWRFSRLARELHVLKCIHHLVSSFLSGISVESLET